MRTDGTGLTAVWILLAIVGGACSEDAPTRTISSSREVAVASSDLRLGAKHDERFGLRTPTAPDSEPPTSKLVWDTPPGWNELAPATMRTANFQVAGDARAECYLTLLPGEAGGLAANVNRWRTQMSQPILAPDAIAALPREQFFGQQSVLIDITGSFSGMSGGAGQPGYRLVGVLLVDAAGSAFLKMVGPDSVISSQIDAFRALARSFRPQDNPAAPASDADVPIAQGSNTAGGITWTAPADWRRAPERATRTVSYFVDADSDVECYVTILGGDAGGALANVNRWRGQMGQPEMSAQELAALPRVPMLGGEAIVAEIDGAAQEEGSAPDTRMLGAVGELPGRAVFVKLTGPRGLVESQRAAFLAFCSSLGAAQ